VGNDVIPLPVPEPALSDDGLLLRPWNERDVEVVLAAGLDGLISRYRYSLPRTTDAARTWITAATAERLAGTRLELAITEDGTPAGSVALAEIAHGNAMVRYWLLPKARGRGLASRAVRLLANWSFSRLDLGRLAAFIELENRASEAVLERCGFVKEGRLRRHIVGPDGKRVDTMLYGLLPEDLRTLEHEAKSRPARAQALPPCRLSSRWSTASASHRGRLGAEVRTLVRTVAEVAPVRGCRSQGEKLGQELTGSGHPCHYIAGRAVPN